MSRGCLSSDARSYISWFRKKKIYLVLSSNFSEVALLSSVFLHVFFASVTKELSGHWCWCETSLFNHSFGMFTQRWSSVVVFGWERTALHFFETESQGAVSNASLNKLNCLHEGGRPSRTVVVDVVDWDSSKTDFVDGPLTAAWVTIDVTNWCVLDFFIGDSGI